jgi:hypothetical protein
MDQKKFKHQHSQVLQILYEAHKNNLITQNEKVKLKGEIL